ncbi:MAG TPA: MarR family transcriptional regulator [Chloroflexia bacterium]|nr:MarR family transcriptional regulator [Chloroflexia bacterium]
MKKRIRLETPGDISMAQASVLAKLDVPGGRTNAELARVEGVKPQSMSATVAEMEAEGYIQRNSDPSDGRRIFLSLTEAGRKLRQSRLTAKQDWLNSILEQLSRMNARNCNEVSKY